MQWVADLFLQIENGQPFTPASEKSGPFTEFTVNITHRGTSPQALPYDPRFYAVEAAADAMGDAADEYFLARECGGYVTISREELAMLRLTLAEIEEDFLRLRHHYADLKDEQRAIAGGLHG